MFASVFKMLAGYKTEHLLGRQTGREIALSPALLVSLLGAKEQARVIPGRKLSGL